MGPEIELKSSGLVALSYEAILLAFSILQWFGHFYLGTRHGAHLPEELFILHFEYIH